MSLQVTIDGKTYEAEGEGDIHVVWDTGVDRAPTAKPAVAGSSKPAAKSKRITHRVLMRNVRYVPTAPAGFVAVAPLAGKGIRFAMPASALYAEAKLNGTVPHPPPFSQGGARHGGEHCLLLSAAEKGTTVLGRAEREESGAWRLMTVPPSEPKNNVAR